MDNQSAFVLDECSDSDFNKTMMSIIFDGMNGQNHFINAIRPHNMTPEGRERARQDYLRMKHLDPSSRWIKATDSATGEMVGIAQWNVYTGEKPAETDLDGPPGKWDSEDDKQWAVSLFRSNMVHRRKVLREASGPVICLGIMAVAPLHQYRGIGTQLARWGTELADRIGAECTVESTLEGRLLYEKVGFVLQKHYLLQVPPRFSDRPKQRLFFMTRPRGG